SRRELQRLSGTHFVATTQPLSPDPGKLAEMCLANRTNLVRWLDILLNQLAELRTLVAEGEREAIQKVLEQAVKMHDSWAVSELDQGEPVDYSAFSTARIMMGDLFRPRNPPEDRSRSGDAGPGNVATGK
ncbi:MAG TPA: hypothetical protein PKJ21_10250, partial [Anaerolineae bacterium]|nr:hypothetical protein [Anaerolineae bacterium]